MTTSILVLGAGELGLAVLTSLAAVLPPTYTLTVLLRPSSISNPSASQETTLLTLKSLNISILPGDIASSTISDLASLFTKFDTLISCLGFASGPGSQLKICKAALEAGTKGFLPWQFGVDYDIIGRGSAQDLFDEQLDVRTLLRSQTTTEWIIISTGMFTSFLFEPSFGVVDLAKGVVRALGSWENKVTVTGPEDIGRLVADVVFSEPRVRNRVLYTAGETVSYGQLAGYVDEFLRRKVKREVWSVEFLKGELEKEKGDGIRKYRVVFAQGKGVSWGFDKTWNWEKGIKVEDVRGWLRRSSRK